MKVAIVGRENVGKSHLFNTLIEERKALVSTVAGTTRDTRFGTAIWRGKELEFMDTAGINAEHEDEINKKVQSRIKDQAEIADVLVFVVDARTGITKYDREIAKLIHSMDKPYKLVVNKVDSQKYADEVHQFIQLGLGEPLAISAATGFGTGDLLEYLSQEVGVVAKKDKYPDKLKLAIIGQPNVGKSSLLNGILGEEKVIVSEIAHTTREPNDIPFNYNGTGFLLVDTAGIRRKRQTKNLEALSILKSIEALENCDIAVLVLDASRKLTSQDLRLAGRLRDAKKGIIVVVNKWDLIEDKDTGTIDKFIRYYQAYMPFLKNSPYIFVSAVEKQRLKKILDLALNIKEEMKRTVTEKELERFLSRIVKRRKPVPSRGTKRPHIFKITQVEGRTPAFEVRIRSTDTLHFSYVRYIENQLRERYGFDGSPVSVYVVRNKSEDNK